MASQSQFPDLVEKMQIEVSVGNQALVLPSFLFTGPLEDDALRRLGEAHCRGDVLSVQPNRTHLASSCCLVLVRELQCGSKTYDLFQGALDKGLQETPEQQVKKYAEYMITTIQKRPKQISGKMWVGLGMVWCLVGVLFLGLDGVMKQVQFS